jgi:hypothetical protein
MSTLTYLSNNLTVFSFVAYLFFLTQIVSLPKHNQLKTKINDSNPKLIKNIFNKPSL